MTSPPASADPNNNTVKKLTTAVTPEGVLDHLGALQKIADDNGGNRAAGSSRLQASVDYVVNQLRGAGYDPQVQQFMFDYFEENSKLIRVSAEPAGRSSTVPISCATPSTPEPRRHGDRHTASG